MIAMTTEACTHEDVACLNEYELVRKYRCVRCGGVMMCACDEERGRRYLPHQLGRGVELSTQRRIPVTLGFQPNACLECRGLPPKAAPKAAIPGHTSKIKRYYWRELHFRMFAILGESGLSPDEILYASGDLRKAAEERALEEIKELHRNSPKYSFEAESEAEFLKRLDVKSLDLKARVRSGGSVEREEGALERPERFVMSSLEREGFQCMECESTPFHALFAVLLWPLIQQPTDQGLRPVTFGERSSFEEQRRSSGQVTALLPEDFGTPGYGTRRVKEIERFFSQALPPERDGLLLSFEAALEGSYGLRQYLWAHRPEDLASVRQVLEVLPATFVRRALRYLVDDYWHNYLGWPDILAWRSSDILFVEVKLSGDKLSDEQRRWIEQNRERLHFPFAVAKIHRIPEKPGK